MADAAVLRQLKIKTGVVKRISKEVGMYQREVIEIEERTRRLAAEGTDIYYLKKQEEVKAESEAMVPDTLRRLDAAIIDLEDMMEDSELANTPEAAEAQRVLEEARTVQE